jgi:hypothetical protein
VKRAGRSTSWQSRRGSNSAGQLKECIDSTANLRVPPSGIQKGWNASVPCLRRCLQERVCRARGVRIGSRELTTSSFAALSFVLLHILGFAAIFRRQSVENFLSLHARQVSINVLLVIGIPGQSFVGLPLRSRLKVHLSKVCLDSLGPLNQPHPDPRSSG